MENMDNFKVSFRRKPTEEDWILAKEAALVTVDKKIVNPPSKDWKHQILRAKHSPIRLIEFVFKLENVPSFVSVHLCRHLHAQPFVKSQRVDRSKTGTPRHDLPQDAPVNMLWFMNAEELMTIAEKRLCNQASEETRFVAKKICELVLAEYPEFEGLLLPPCKKYGKCFEMYPCGKAPVEM